MYGVRYENVFAALFLLYVKIYTFDKLQFLAQFSSLSDFDDSWTKIVSGGRAPNIVE